MSPRTGIIDDLSGTISPQRAATQIRLPATRQQVGSAPQHLISPRAEKTSAIDVMPSPRAISQSLINSGNELAAVIFAEIRSGKEKLTKEVIDAIGRQDIALPIDKLPSALAAKVLADENSKPSHSTLIQALFLPSLMATEVGKTLVAMRSMVMTQYDGDSMTVAQRLETEEKSPDFKSRMAANIEEQTNACAAIALGCVSLNAAPSLSASKLPAELISFWKAMDAQLCAWASANPALDPALLSKARSNLGFDILFTRLIMPVALGSKTKEAGLAIPMIFCDSVKEAFKARWPAFMDSFIAATQANASALMAPALNDASHSITTASVKLPEGALNTGGAPTT